jgi:hypothetical protein
VHLFVRIVTIKLKCTEWRMWKHEFLFISCVLHAPPSSSFNNVLQGTQMFMFTHCPKFSGLLLPTHYDFLIIIPTNYYHLITFTLQPHTKVQTSKAILTGLQPRAQSVLARFRKTAENENKVTSLKQSRYPMWGIITCQMRMKRQFCTIQDVQHTDCHSSFISLCYRLFCLQKQWD